MIPPIRNWQPAEETTTDSPTSVSNTSLQAVDLTLAIGGKTLAIGLSFSLQAGSLLAIIGPNGAGKSTLLNSVSQPKFLPKGGWLLNDMPISTLPSHHMAPSLAYLPQQAGLKFPLPVSEVVELGLWPHRRHLDKGIAYWVTHCLQQVDMEWAIHKPYTRLSGGERQRVQLARVLAQVLAAGGPTGRVLLRDEPTAGLDPRHSLQILQVVRTLCEKGLTCVWVEHDLNLARRLSTHALLLAPHMAPLFANTAQVMTTECLAKAYACSFVEFQSGERSCIMAV